MAGSQLHGGKWYAAHLIFESRVGHALEMDPLCEDRVVLFFASDERSAREAAVQYGQREKQAYRNERGEPVEWFFVGLDELEELGSDPEKTGWEVASRHFRRSDLRREKEVEDRASAD